MSSVYSDGSPACGVALAVKRVLLPLGAAQHPYRLQMRMHALEWRLAKLAGDRDEMYAALRLARVFCGFYSEMIVRRAGA